MVQVELNNMCINIGANNGSEKLCTRKNTATSHKLIKAVYASYVSVYKVLNIRPTIKPRFNCDGSLSFKLASRLINLKLSYLFEVNFQHVNCLPSVLSPRRKEQHNSSTHSKYFRDHCFESSTSDCPHVLKHFSIFLTPPR
jgi:hypothetical protein